jgi:hypothetical protein
MRANNSPLRDGRHEKRFSSTLAESFRLVRRRIAGDFSLHNANGKGIGSGGRGRKNRKRKSENTGRTSKVVLRFSLPSSPLLKHRFSRLFPPALKAQQLPKALINMAGPPSTSASSSGRRQSAPPRAPPSGLFGPGTSLEGQSFETLADKLKDPNLGASVPPQTAENES